MSRLKWLVFLSLVLALAAPPWGIDQGSAQNPNAPGQLKYRDKKPTPAEQQAAAQRAAKLGLKPGVAGLAPMAAVAPLPGQEGPGGVPHYFGPYGNWAFSPMPSFGLLSTVTIDSPGSRRRDRPVAPTKYPLHTA